jgi:hypothetical protein
VVVVCDMVVFDVVVCSMAAFYMVACNMVVFYMKACMLKFRNLEKLLVLYKLGK